MGHMVRIRPIGLALDAVQKKGKAFPSCSSLAAHRLRERKNVTAGLTNRDGDQLSLCVCVCVCKSNHMDWALKGARDSID